MSDSPPEYEPLALPAQHPRTDPPTEAAPIPRSRDTDDPLSPEGLWRWAGEIETAILAAQRVRRVSRNPTADPEWRLIWASLAIHLDVLEDLLAIAVTRPPPLTMATWMAWRAAWRLYKRAYLAMHGHTRWSVPPTFVPPEMPPT